MGHEQQEPFCSYQGHLKINVQDISVLPNKPYVQIAKSFNFGQDIWKIRPHEISFSTEYLTIKTYVHNPKNA